MQAWPSCNLDSERKAGGDKQAVWEWVVSDFGQSFLIKRRLRPKNLPDTQWPAKERYVTVTPTWTSAVERQQTANSGPAELVGLQTDASAGALRPGRAGPQAGVNVDDILGWVEGRGADDASIGFATRRMAESGTIEQMVAFGIALRDVVRRVRRA